jgi:hypothetical protein
MRNYCPKEQKQNTKMSDSNEELIEVRQQIVITHIIQRRSQNSDQ